MPKSRSLQRRADIDGAIFLIRGQRVMIDADLAPLYGVETKVLNQAVKRNRERFPVNFMFRLKKKEKDELVTNCDRFNRLKHSTSLPFAFTEHGAIMLASVLNSRRAVEMSIYVVEAFVRLREFLSRHKVIAQKLAELERKVSGHDLQIRALFDAIRELMKPPQRSRKPIGFR